MLEFEDVKWGIGIFEFRFIWFGFQEVEDILN